MKESEAASPHLGQRPEKFLIVCQMSFTRFIASFPEASSLGQCGPMCCKWHLHLNAPVIRKGSRLCSWEPLHLLTLRVVPLQTFEAPSGVLVFRSSLWK